MIPAWLTDTVTPNLDRALHYTHLWGLEGIELRTLGGPSDRVPYVNEGKLKRRLAEHDVPVVAVVPGMFEGDAAARTAWLNEVVAFGETLAFCRRIGCRLVVVSAFSRADDPAPAVDALRRAGTAAARQGCTVAVLNEAGGAFPTGTALAGLLAAVDHPNVRAAWSPAEALQAGEAPEEGLQALAGRVALVRCRDGQPGRSGWTPLPFGEGAVGWERQLRLLHRQGFQGPLSLELDVEPRPRQGLRAATRLIEMMRALQRNAS
ncbi:MAG: AP endonuclease [Rhodothermaceae bacterium]|nr:MAG: AP endonuclease [Rhodothermaceae bacterium]